MGPQGHVIDGVEFELPVDMRQQRDQIPAAAEVDEDSVADGAGPPAPAVSAIGMDRQHAGRRLAALRGLDAAIDARIEAADGRIASAADGGSDVTRAA